MSRRHSRIQPLPWNDHPHAHWEDVSWWWDEIPGYEPWTWADWQDAFADVTLGVCNNVWRNQGARLYAAHRDHALRDDLQSWLVAEAQETASRFIPDPTHPNPHLQWAAYLYRTLNAKARYHFAEAVGYPNTTKGQAARAVYTAGVVSTEYLDELEAETGRTIGRHALHGRPFGTEDPASVIIRLEGILTQLADLNRHGGDDVFTTTSEVCLVNLCNRPVHVKSRGLCDSHYNLERRNAVERGDWQPHRTEHCTVDGCSKPHHARGRCRTHYIELRAAEVARCTEDDCQEPVHARGLCSAHYARARAARPTPPCNVDGCEKKSATRGMCPMHYQRWRKARATGETDAP